MPAIARWPARYRWRGLRRRVKWGGKRRAGVGVWGVLGRGEQGDKEGALKKYLLALVVSATFAYDSLPRCRQWGR
ncbi:hypothetical protein B0O95_111109 [Mycetohabitans endofungorum]|uniref:Uncharacterized protein n=1 Tax=Mycetohabitans endofungorum TaxID=417203 RepID=A0A2P5K8J7_9BURK|nr:hypothetical protein B0O95_111109 [Mycetohabitans endofungorum]